MVGARVSFLDLSTSASLIELTDNEGTPLPNPLFTRRGKTSVVEKLTLVGTT